MNAETIRTIKKGKKPLKNTLPLNQKAKHVIIPLTMSNTYEYFLVSRSDKHDNPINPAFVIKVVIIPTMDNQTINIDSTKKA